MEFPCCSCISCLLSCPCAPPGGVWLHLLSTAHSVLRTAKRSPPSLLLFPHGLQPPPHLKNLSWPCSRTAINLPPPSLLVFTQVAVNGQDTWNRDQIYGKSTQPLLHSRWVTFDASGKSGRRGQSVISLLLPVTGDGQEETSSPFREELICAFTKHSMASLSQVQRNCSQGSPDSGNKTKIQTRRYWKKPFPPSAFSSL